TTTRELYWCALVTLVGDPGEIPVFDRVFFLVFGDSVYSAAHRGETNSFASRTGAEPAPPPRSADGQVGRKLPSMAGAQPDDAPSSADDEEPEAESLYPSLAAEAERLGGRDFGTLSPDE